MDGAAPPGSVSAAMSLTAMVEEAREAGQQQQLEPQDQIPSTGSAEQAAPPTQPLSVALARSSMDPADAQQPAAVVAAGPQLMPAAASQEADPKRSICFDFCKGQCTRGTACKFSHDLGTIIAVNSQEKGLCFDHLKGLCTRGLLCRFSHDLRNLQTPQCTASSAKKRFAPICYDFVKNQCTRGEDCKYSHDYSSILYGPRAPGKDPYVICVDFTRGKCARGSSCRYSHVDPHMLSSPALPGGNVHPALLAAGLGAAAAAAAVAQTSSMPGAMPGLVGLNGAAAMAPPVRQPSDLQAQAALLLSGLGGAGLLGSGLPSTPVASGVGAGSISAAWPGMSGLQQNAAAMQQSPEGIAALLEQLQRTALTDSLTQLSPTAGDAVSLSALNALMATGQLSPSYAAGLAAGDSLAAELQRNANLAASLLQNQGSSLAGMLAEQQQQQQAGGAQQQQQQQLYQQGSDNAAAAAALLQSHLSSEATLGNLPGSAPVSAAPTPTAAAAAMAPTVFQQQRGPSPATSGLDVPVSAAAAMPAQQPPKSQPLMAVYHPLLQQKAGAGLRADILVDARSNNSPTIPASWGGVAPGAGAPGADVGLQQQQQQSALAAQLKQHAAAGLPPPPPPVQVSAPAAVEHPAGVPMELPNSYDRMQLLWGQGSIWGQRQ